MYGNNKKLYFFRIVGQGVVSPVSIFSAFSLLLGAARNSSLAELKTALQIDASIPDDKLHALKLDFLKSQSDISKDEKSES